MFEKSLSDMVKGIRAHKDEEGDFINKCLAEIKDELKNQDIAIKAQAVQKLIYLHMLGYDISWASFHIVEVMSQPSFAQRRIAYLAASQSFGPKTDVILLTTHLFRKAFSQALSGSAAAGVAEGQMYDTGSAINCLANICTPDLANDLLSDLYGLMNSSKPYIRKKAVLVLLRIFHQWPKALRLSFDRLKAKLTDDDPTVVSAAVYVVCELARLNPKNYVALAPLFFKILTSSTNNWVLIKVVKLMGSLLPLEPRLAKKLAGPLCEIIETTAAKSLLYECVNTLLCGEVTSKNVLRTCVTKLRSFIEDTDQNLKYLGLLGLHRLMRQHPRAVAEHKDLILACLTDDDVTIRMRALDLISGMVSKRNIKGIIKKLVEHLQTADGSYREHVLERVITICNQENYSFISDFEWYVATLVELTNVTGVSVASAQHISQQLLDVTMRVEGVRPFAVAEMERLLLESRLLTDRNEMSHVLFAAAWITGEYAEMVDDHLSVIRAMLSADVNTLPPDVQNVFLQSFYKVFAASLHQTFAVDGRSVIHVPQSLPMKQNLGDDLGILGYTGDATPSKSAAERALSPTSGRSPSPPSGGDGDDEISVSGARDTTDDVDPDAPKEWTKYSYGGKRLKTLPEWQSHVQNIVDCITAQLPVFCLSNFVEVQERAVAYLHYVKWIAGQVLSPSTSIPEVANLISAFAGLFSEKLNPVNAKAQKKVPLPTGLNLDKQINKVEDSDDEDEEDDGYSLDYREPSFGESASNLKLSSQEQAQRAADQRARDKARRANDPYYIKDTPSKDSHRASEDEEEEDKPKVAAAAEVSKDSKRKGHRARKSHAFSDDEDDEAAESRKSKYSVKVAADMPAGASSDEDGKNSDEDDRLGGVDLTTPLGADEVMPRARTYAEVKEARDKQAAEERKKKKKTDEKDKKKKDKEKDKEKKHKKDKHKDKDSDDKEKSKKKDKKEEKPKEAGPTVVADIFDPLAVSAAAKKPEKEEKAKDKEKSKKHHKDDKEKEKKHKDKDKEKEKDSKDKKKSKKDESSKDKESSSEKKSSKSSEPAVPEEYAENAARERVLFCDGSVRVLYVVMTDSSSSRAATAHIRIHSAVNLERVGITVSDSSFVRVRSKAIAASGVSANKPVYLMGAIQLELAKLSGPQKLDAAITYTVDAKAKETKAKAELRLNCSDLLLPTRITIDDLRDLLSRSGKSDEEKANGCGALASAQLPLSRHGVSDALKLIAKVLNVKLIEAVSFTATYYGRSIQGQHVAVLVKANKQDVQSERPVLSIDIKTSLQSFSDGLLQELRDLLV